MTRTAVVAAPAPQMRATVAPGGRRTPWVALLVVATVVIAAEFALGGTATPNRGVTNAAAALGIIGASSVSIERILELFWSAIGLLGSSWWPLNTLANGINEVVDGVNGSIEPFLAEVETAIDDAAKAASWTQAQIAAAQAEVASVRAQLARFQALAPDDTRATLLLGAATQAVNYLGSKYDSPQLKAAGAAALAAIAEAGKLVATFKDNPGRRLVSIYLGMVIGLAVAYALGLDLYLATTGTQLPLSSVFHWGVPLTGIVMGLGSSPTHEVIMAIQEFKQNLKS